jgi:hypothetical protein
MSLDSWGKTPSDEANSSIRIAASSTAKSRLLSDVSVRLKARIELNRSQMSETCSKLHSTGSKLTRIRGARGHEPLSKRNGARERTRTFTPCGRYHLKVVRLPISPPAQRTFILPQGRSDSNPAAANVHRLHFVEAEEPLGPVAGGAAIDVVDLEPGMLQHGNHFGGDE